MTTFRSWHKIKMWKWKKCYIHKQRNKISIEDKECKTLIEQKDRKALVPLLSCLQILLLKHLEYFYSKILLFKHVFYWSTLKVGQLVRRWWSPLWTVDCTDCISVVELRRMSMWGERFARQLSCIRATGVLLEISGTHFILSFVLHLLVEYTCFPCEICYFLVYNCHCSSVTVLLVYVCQIFALCLSLPMLLRLYFPEVPLWENDPLQSRWILIVNQIFDNFSYRIVHYD